MILIQPTTVAQWKDDFPWAPSTDEDDLGSKRSHQKWIFLLIVYINTCLNTSSWHSPLKSTLTLKNTDFHSISKCTYVTFLKMNLNCMRIIFGNKNNAFSWNVLHQFSTFLSIQIIIVCRTSMWSTSAVFRNRQFAHSESHWIAINVNVTSWRCDVTWRRVFANMKKDVSYRHR